MQTFMQMLRLIKHTHKQNKAYEMIIFFHNEGSWTAQGQLLSKSKSGFTGETVLELELG